MRKAIMLLPFIFSFFMIMAADQPATNQAAGDEGWQTASAPGFMFKYRVKGDKLDCDVKSSTTGWIAAGFNTAPTMNKARIIMGCVDKNGLRVEEQIGKGHGHSKLKIQKLENLFGEERNGQTEIQFTIPLDNGNKDSLVLKQGNKYHVILAVGPNDNFGSRHVRKATIVITL